MKNIFLSVGVILFLAACAAPNTQPLPLPTKILTQTKQPALTTIPLPIASHTLIATNTLTLPVKPTQSPRPSLTPNLVATVMATQQPRLYASYLSPDSKWRVDIIIYDCVKTSRSEEGDWNENAYEQLTLKNLASGEELVADEQLQYCGGLGAYGFDGRYWSTDSRYFYYTTARQGVPDGCGYWEPPLYRFDVLAIAAKQYLGMGSRSPDGEKIASWNWPENTLIIWDTNGGESRQFATLEPKAEIGPIAWSANSQSVVYIQVDSWCPLTGKSYLVSVDITKPGQTLLLESESPTFGSARWVSSEVLILSDENGDEWEFNVNTRELTKKP